MLIPVEIKPGVVLKMTEADAKRFKERQKASERVVETATVAPPERAVPQKTPAKSRKAKGG